RALRRRGRPERRASGALRRQRRGGALRVRAAPCRGDAPAAGGPAYGAARAAGLLARAARAAYAGAAHVGGPRRYGQGTQERVAALEAAVQAAQAGHESLQAECAALEERSAAAGEALGAAQREHAAAEAQLATLRQIQAAAEDNAPLREWLERHGLGALPRLWQKLRIDRGWETAVESVLRERLHALELSEAARLQSVLADRPPAKASVFARGNR